MKYKLIDETINHKGRILYRIQAVKDFAQVKKDDIGGWIESEDNLSHKGHAWVADEAKVYGLGKVYEDGYAMDSAEIYGVASLSGMAIACENAKIHGAVKVYGSAIIGDNHDLTEKLHIFRKGRLK